MKNRASGIRAGGIRASRGPPVVYSYQSDFYIGYLKGATICVLKLQFDSFKISQKLFFESIFFFTLRQYE